MLRSLSVYSLTVSLALVGVGCATKNHVRTRVEPLEKRVGGLEAKDRETESTIATLEKGISAADERAKGADGKAAEAAKEAARAHERVSQVGEQAENANRAAAGAKSLAEQGLTKGGELEQRMLALDNFQLISSKNVLFDFAKATLSEDAKKALDEAAAEINSQKRFIVEVQGFTDKSGRADTNLELSRKRASEVVRYLTVQHKIPLYRIFVQGAGSLVPVADDKTRDGRKQNRRVEVRIYSADGKKVTAAVSGGR